ncbi:MAG: glycosyltransferase family 1 protein [Bacteroidales bacterium]|nr:glycosyltransferase family 1 protein [Bacteroidales bacterium]MCM1414583.1 glycosyltransferase family 1 protein [bacterium]MCM1423868.1 glycosyltransferase family 1 protein [bacterium]
MAAKSPIHVLHVLGGVGLGGAESRIMDLYRRMDRDEIQFDFLIHSQAVSRSTKGAADSKMENDTNVIKNQYYASEIASLGGRIFALPKFRVYNYFAYRKAVRDFFREHHEFQVVQGHMTSTAVIYLPIAKKAGVPITVAHARNAGVEKNLKGAATRFFRRNLAKKADFLFACSRLAGEDVFGKKAMEQGRVKVIHNAIEVKRFAFQEAVRKEMRETLGITDSLVLGHVGRFDYQKNHPYLLEVFAAVCKERKDAVLLLLGEGKARPAMEERCRELGIAERVRFLGNQKETERYYQAMDVFLLPSFFEGLPGVLVEAQAAGLKCLVSDTVTKEAQAADLVTWLAIDDPPERWAKEALKQAAYVRRDTEKELTAAGFDVRTQAAAYTNFYQNGDCSEL